MRNVPHSLKHRNPWLPVDCTVWGGLCGADLVEEYVPGADFETIQSRATSVRSSRELPAPLPHLLLLLCLPAVVGPHPSGTLSFQIRCSFYECLAQVFHHSSRKVTNTTFISLISVLLFIVSFYLLF